MKRLILLWGCLLVMATGCGEDSNAFQATTVVPNGTGAQVRTNMNNAFQAITTGQSGTSAPSPSYSFMEWVDTSTTPPTVRMRNSANSDWVVIGTINDTGPVFTTSNAANAATVGGFAASQSPSANQIPVLNSSGDFFIGSNYIAYLRGTATNFGLSQLGILSSTQFSDLGANTYYDGSHWARQSTGPAALLENVSDGSLDYYIATSGSGGSTIAWNGPYTVWHSGNMGSGSGLDADKLDGKHWVNITTSSVTLTASASTTINLRAGGSHHFYRVSVYGTSWISIEGLNANNTVSNGYYIIRKPSGSNDILAIYAETVSGDTIYYQVDSWE